MYSEIMGGCFPKERALVRSGEYRFITIAPANMNDEKQSVQLMQKVIEKIQTEPRLGYYVYGCNEETVFLIDSHCSVQAADLSDLGELVVHEVRPRKTVPHSVREHQRHFANGAVTTVKRHLRNAA